MSKTGFKTKTCLECGEEFNTRHKSVVTCSPECRHQRNNKLKREAKDRKRMSKGRVIECKICEKEFTTYKANIKCCSPECTEENRIILNNTRDRKAGKIGKIDDKYLTRGRIQYCSGAASMTGGTIA